MTIKGKYNGTRITRIKRMYMNKSGIQDLDKVSSGAADKTEEKV
jgi:hypothetical protein